MDLQLLSRTVLFKGMTEDETASALLSLQAKLKEFKRAGRFFMPGISRMISALSWQAA